MEWFSLAVDHCVLLRRMSVAATLVLASASGATAETPHVRFDVPYVVAARDVCSPEFSAAFPDEKLVEIKLQVSSLLASGDEADLRQYLYAIVSPNHTMQVVDYLPKTEHETSVAGNLKVERSNEKTTSVGINVAGQYQSSPQGSFNSGFGDKKASSVSFEQLPPLESVTASGTIDRGNGVYFKLKASNRNLLEGSRDVAMIVRVPATWRADLLQVRCEADGFARSFTRSLDSLVSCGQQNFQVAVYLEGDMQARAMAEDALRREAQFRHASAQRAAVAQQHAKPDLAKLFKLPAKHINRAAEGWQQPAVAAPSMAAASTRFPSRFESAVEPTSRGNAELSNRSNWQAADAAGQW